MSSHHHGENFVSELTIGHLLVRFFVPGLHQHVQEIRFTSSIAGATVVNDPKNDVVQMGQGPFDPKIFGVGTKAAPEMG